MSDAHDHEWLHARERGEDPGDVPAQTRRKYEHLQALIAELPGEAPSPGWQERVLDAIDQPAVETAAPRPAARGLRRWMGVAALAAAALLVVVVLTRPRAPDSSEPTLVTEVRAGTSPHRGGDVNIGDTLVVKADADAPAELRVYGASGEPLARCAETATASCVVTREGNRVRFRIELVLRARGAVRSILFVGPAIPVGTSLDDDLAAAAREKISTISAVPVVVQ